MDFKILSEQYKNELLNKVVPFWENNSLDKEFGGYFTCLKRDGEVFDTDKFIWLQARQVWMFAKLYNEVEQKPEWLQIALDGAEFLQKYGHDGKLNWYFSLTREGKPLVQPYNIFSDCFATMAFGQLSKATGNDEFAAISKDTFQNILKRSDNPKGDYNKLVPGTRPLKGFSLPMILCNLALEIEHLLDPELVNSTVEKVLHEVMEVFYQPDSGLILENVNPDGSFSDSFEGRLLNPGHAIEAMWFIMDLSERLKRPELAQKAVDIALRTLKYGWDEKFGGIFYFLDIKGNPPQQLEWDQKLWWVHIETLITLIKGYALTGNEECLAWFEKVHDYSWAHFADAEYGEWYGYLNRQGEVLLPLKGGKWKGCFHVPRGMFQVWKTLEKLNEK
ncbi:N-acylglucosamine 2-epimerase [Draconibacterium orientale]|uniref:N-acylglucosamine 2-epimerase n=1 Tax=Draconibacterium orientale TaxID=1168034 RepID=X5DYR1_9BACT|nr:AGE family epimerase/isomerase [Draconibacterium orientale]AHW60350.1 N-acylglucosamine 2-epimerase [Draconibacterium orientale]SET82338.1 N-acylglucosamine 2-epimerase [Draconibacterium orientale]